MTQNIPKDPRSVAVSTLESLGLSSYAARTFVALVALGEGTAQDVSDVSEVPRSRVYDAVEELEERGLVDVHNSRPKRFWSISTETTRRLFEQEYAHRVDELATALRDVEPAASTTEQSGVWTVTGREVVEARVLEFIQDAEEEIIYMTVGGLLTDDIVDALRDAAERDVPIRVAGIAESVEMDIREAVPGVETFESLWVWSDTPAGRLLMVDQDRTLVSVLVDEADENAASDRDETAIWGSGATNGLVVVLRAIFTWQLDGARE